MPLQPNINSQRITGTELSLTGGTVYALNLSGGTIYSGSTLLSTIISNASGGVSAAQLATKANLSGATFTGTINATSILTSAFQVGNIAYSTGDILYGGAGQQSFLQIASSIAQLGHFNTRTVWNNGYITNSINNFETQRQTGLLTTINTDVLITGTTTFGSLSARTLSATTIFSGATTLSSMIDAKAPTANPSFTGTIRSGGTDISLLFASAAITGGGSSTNTKTFSGNDSQSTTYTDFIYTGGGSNNFTLLTLAGGTNFKLNVYNIGSGGLNINSNAGANDIYDMGGVGATNSISVNPNEAYTLVCNGTYFVARKLGL